MNAGKLFMTTVLLTAFFLFCPSALEAGGSAVSDDLPRHTAVRRSVRRATVKKAKKTPASVQKKNVAAQAAATTPQQPGPDPLVTGVSLLERELYSRARPWLQKAVKDHPADPWAWYWCGVCFDKSGQFQQAQFYFTKAVELAPSFPPLARTMRYPDGDDRTALWDPRKKADIKKASSELGGMTMVPPEMVMRPRLPQAVSEDREQEPGLPFVVVVSADGAISPVYY